MSENDRTRGPQGGDASPDSGPPPTSRRTHPSAGQATLPPPSAPPSSRAPGPLSLRSAALLGHQTMPAPSGRASVLPAPPARASVLPPPPRRPSMLPPPPVRPSGPPSARSPHQPQPQPQVQAPASSPPSSISSVNKAILALDKIKAKLEAVERQKAEPVAIIGMACRFPGGGDTPEAFFDFLKDGGDAVTLIPQDRWRLDADLAAATPEGRAVQWGAFLAGPVDRFDARFFGISPREAVHLDPQQRLLLELSWEALERAGQDPARLAGGLTGVFVGVSNNDYLDLCKATGPEGEDVYAATGNGHAFAAGHLSYAFGFQGPSLTVDTVCSSSLVAVHLACQSLRSGEATVCLAAGVNLMLTPDMTRLIANMRALSPDGRCKSFDAAANGFVRGEGSGVVVLKLLSDALRDGDPILALIRGSAVNQNGRSQGLTTPNVLAQQAMLRQALASARASADEIGYVETQGTGTVLGDPIEFEALRAVIGGPRHDGAPCVLGAVKSNIGHLEAAAGMAGLIKAVMAFQEEMIPRNLHFRALNPRLSLEGTPFVIPTENLAWPRGDKPRLAGVSAFGMSGTNAHLVLEEPPVLEPAAATHEARSTLLPLSAKSAEALRTLAEAYAGVLAGDDVRLVDVAYTASVRRAHHEHRLAVTGRTREEVAEALLRFAQDGVGVRGNVGNAGRRRLVNVFSGEGSQWAGMGRQLMAEEPVFRAKLEQCGDVLARYVSWNLLDELNASEDRSRLAETKVVQPLLFAIQVSLAKLLKSWDVRPDAVIGHGVGEVAAAHVAGCLSLDDAARLVAWRGRILQKAAGAGKMVWVELPAERVVGLIAGRGATISIAAIENPGSVVLSGATRDLDEIVEGLIQQGVRCRALPGNLALHSPQMTPLAGELAAALGRVKPLRGAIPVYSSVTGAVIEGEALHSAYWARNVRDPVMFAQAVAAALGDGHRLFLEIGPQPMHAANLAQCLAAEKEEAVATCTLRKRIDERRAMLDALGLLYTRGFAPDWKAVGPVDARHAPLPTYPWQRERYWVEAAVPSRRAGGSEAPASRAPRTASRRAREAILAAPPAERQERIERLVRHELAHILRVDPAELDLRGTFYGYGFDSLMSIELRNRLEAELGVKVSVADIVAHPRIDALAQQLAQVVAGGDDGAPPSTARSGAPGSWIVIPRPSPGAKVRLVCFPYSGGSASIFGKWPGGLPSAVEVCAVQPPGRHERLHERLLHSVDEMVAGLVPALLPYLDRPFATFGHSLGAIVMFETLRKIAGKHGLRPVVAFASGARPPSEFVVSSLVDRPRTELARLVQTIGFGDASVMEDDDAARYMLPALEADLEAAARYAYVPGGPLDAPIMAFAGREDPFAPPEAMEGWRSYTSLSFSRMVFPGEHYFIVPEQERLLGIIGEELLGRVGKGP